MFVFIVKLLFFLTLFYYPRGEMPSFFELIIESTLCVTSTENLGNFKEVMGDLSPPGIFTHVGVKVSAQADDRKPVSGQQGQTES